MGLFKRLLAILTILTTTACGEFNSSEFKFVAQQGKTSEQAPPVNMPAEDSVTIKWPAFDWDNMHNDYLQWNELTFNGVTELGPSLIDTVPADINSFCPRYETLKLDERKMFWISLIAAMSRYESFFDPSVFFEEAFKNSRGEFVVSRGLLQLSSESSRGYGCPVETEADLHNPKINLECTIRILNRWIKRDGVISDKIEGEWKGGARYWSVLRSENRIAQIKAKTNNFEVCN